MAEFSSVTYSLLLSKITSAMSGVKDIKLKDERTITFTTNNDEEFNITLPVPDIVWVGDTEPDADSSYELWVDTSDQGTTPITRAILSEDIKATTTVGGVSTGTTFKVGESLEDVLRNILTIKTKPKVTIGINPTTTIYDSTTQTLSSLIISANVTKGSSDIDRVKFYIDGQLVNTTTECVASGGVIKYTHTFSPAQKKTFVVKIDAVDTDGESGSSQTTVNFVAPSYYGYLPETTTFDATAIKSLTNKELKIKKELTYTGITTPGTDSYYITYCYPTELGTITSIKDSMNFEYIQDFDVSSITIDDVAYTLMHQTDPGSVADYTQKFT